MLDTHCGPGCDHCSSATTRHQRRFDCETQMKTHDMSDDSRTEDKNQWCPSCRLSISQETGRLKWCPEITSGGWRNKKYLLMVLLPLASLPITLLLIAVAQHNASNQAPNPRVTASSHTHSIQVPFVYDPELAELEDREVMQDVKTNFVPPQSLSVFLRRKRDDGLTWYPDQVNATTEAIVWKVPQRSGVAKRGGNNNKLDNNAVTREAGGNFTREDGSQGLPEVRMSPRPELSEASGNILSDNYPDVEAEGSLDTADLHESFSDVDSAAAAGELSEDLPWRTVVRDENSDQTAGKEEEEEEEEDTRRDVNYEQEAEERDEEEEQQSEFQMFWKGEGDMDTIKKAQAKMMLQYMDVTVDPCVDFYQYACGNWGRRNPIPKDKSAYDTFEMLRESLDSVLRDLLEEPTIIQEGQSLEELMTNDAIVKAKNLYHSCMDHEILERRSVQPLMSLLKELGGWPILEPDWDGTEFDWLLLTAKLRLFNNDILISEWVGPDIKNSDEYIIQFDQTSLGLPSREYFLQETNLIYLQAYKNYLIMVTTLLGASLDAAMTNADDLIEFETKLAQITSSQEDRRNVSELYQRMPLSDLQHLVPQIHWVRYLSLVLARPVGHSEPVVVFAVKYIQDLIILLDGTEPKTIANYLLWRFVRHRVNNLDDRFQAAKQRFYYILFGREQAPLRWKNCVAQVNGNMGMAVGAMFVRKYFDENSKNDTLHMTEEIMESFRETLFYTNWIDMDTMLLATLKVDAMMLRIGYPDFILNLDLLNEWYADVVIRRDEYFENTLHILQHLTRFEQDRLGTAVNKTLWSTAPAVVNAYYSRNKNQIMFPAGILQPPFYHRYFPRSLNFGGIGVVIGHEITHGFDDKGRLFDKDGNLHRWWHDAAVEMFHQRAQCLIDQYSLYTVEEVSMQVDGVNTQGENIADNGGIKQAFRAYQRWLDANEEEDDSLPGLEMSGKQLFFLNFAQIWCGSMRPEATRNKLKTAVHSPGKFRVIGTLSNSEDFAQVFSCPSGSPMNPSDKCSVW